MADHPRAGGKAPLYKANIDCGKVSPELRDEAVKVEDGPRSAPSVSNSREHPCRYLGAHIEGES
jgi:hypothetical protein